MGLSSHSYLPHCRVLLSSEFNVMIQLPRATLQGERISSAILKIVFRRLYFCFSNAVWALAIGYFRIVFDTLVSGDMQGQNNKWRPLIPQLPLADKFLHGYLYLYGKYLPAYQILTS